MSRLAVPGRTMLALAPVFVWAVALGLGSVSPAIAQDIDDLDEGVVMEAPFEPGVEDSRWELNLQIGYYNLDQILMDSPGIIVDVENPVEVIYASMEIRGEQSFSPQLRVNRTFGDNWAVENALAFVIGDFQQTVAEDQEHWTQPSPTNSVTENEIEAGSYFVWFHEHSLVYYPRGKGRIQPFVLAGIGTQHYHVDSAYIEGGSSNLAFSYGAGLRVVGDDLYSIRVEVRNYHTSVEYTPTAFFREDTVNLAGDMIIGFPNSQLVDRSDLSDAQLEQILRDLDLWDPAEPFDRQPFGNLERYPMAVESFEKHSYSSLWISVGFVAAF